MKERKEKTKKMKQKTNREFREMQAYKIFFRRAKSIDNNNNNNYVDNK